MTARQGWGYCPTQAHRWQFIVGGGGWPESRGSTPPWPQAQWVQCGDDSQACERAQCQGMGGQVMAIPQAEQRAYHLPGPLQQPVLLVQLEILSSCRNRKMPLCHQGA